MKKLIIFISVFCLSFTFCGCKKKQTETTSAINQKIASQICQIENYDTLSPETIKALSVVFRTNIKNGENISALENYLIDENILLLTKETDGEILDDVSNIISLDKNEEWVLEIPKTKLLEFFSTKGEHISSFSNIKLEKDNNERTEKLVISEKKLSSQELKNNFSLKSNKIEKFETTQSSLILYGKGFGFGENFDIFEAETLAKNGYSYEAIIKSLKNRL